MWFVIVGLAFIVTLVVAVDWRLHRPFKWGKHGKQ